MILDEMNLCTGDKNESKQKQFILNKINLGIGNKNESKQKVSFLPNITDVKREKCFKSFHKSDIK